ncbi:MAG: ABC transporter permease [Treponema sp.]|nr:ABC transporter permease [Treponema sp.]MBR0487418.1 ABC transporter permease [Treponema sp.]
MNNSLTIKTIAIKNLTQRKYRTALLLSLIGLSAAILFTVLILVTSLFLGIKSVEERLGADLLVVPEGYENQVQAVIMSGQPNYFYMDKEVEQIVASVSGVAAVSSQFYLTSLSESCCDFPIQLIGFDSDSDFVVKSWTGKNIKNTEGVLFAGAGVPIENECVRFFGQSHQVSSILAKTGSGMDYAVYTDKQTLQSIFEDARAKGFAFISDGDVNSKISTVLVKLEEGAKIDSTILKIKMAVPGVKVIESDRMLKNNGKTLSGLLTFLYALVAVFMVVTIFTLAFVFSLSINERLKEFSILRTLGATRKKLSAIIVLEAVILGSAGGLAGIILSSLIVFPFNALIAQNISLPFIVPQAEVIAVYAVITFVVAVLSSVLASLKGAVRIAGFEPYESIK